MCRSPAINGGSAAYSVIIVRGAHGVVRAFHNVCRHRGAASSMTSAARPPAGLPLSAGPMTSPVRWSSPSTSPPMSTGRAWASSRCSCAAWAGFFSCASATIRRRIISKWKRSSRPISARDLRNCKIAKQEDVVVAGGEGGDGEQPGCYLAAGIPSCSRSSSNSSPHSEADAKPRQRAYYERYRRHPRRDDRHLGKKRPAVASCRASRRPSHRLPPGTSRSRQSWRISRSIPGWPRNGCSVASRHRVSGRCRFTPSPFVGSLSE